jgi:hypothetical protein
MHNGASKPLAAIAGRHGMIKTDPVKQEFFFFFACKQEWK